MKRCAREVPPRRHDWDWCDRPVCHAIAGARAAGVGHYDTVDAVSPCGGVHVVAHPARMHGLVAAAVLARPAPAFSDPQHIRIDH